jgi:hypothetical protein
MRPIFLVPLLLACTLGAEDPLLELTDDTLKAALADDANRLMLLAIGVENCEPCAHVERQMRKAHKELRVKANGQVTLAKLRITSQDSPVIGEIVQGQLTIPKLLIFREGEAMDFDGEATKASIVEVSAVVWRGSTTTRVPPALRWHARDAADPSFSHLPV